MAVPYINLHTHRQDTEIDTLSVRNALYRPGETKLPDGPYSIGLHPWDSGEIPFSAPYRQDFLHHLTGRTVAIGEIGLDYAVALDTKTRSRQELWFQWQLSVATVRKLPVIVHCVKAFNPLIDILQGLSSGILPVTEQLVLPYDGPRNSSTNLTPVVAPPAVTLPESGVQPKGSAQSGVPLILHGYIGSPELTRSLVELNCYFSFGFPLLKSPKTQRSLSELPPDRLFLETDEADAPVSALYNAVSRLLNWPEEEIKKQIYDNYTRIFKAHD